MRKNFLLALLGMAAMFTGCNNDAVEDLTASKATSFTIGVDEGVNTRASEPTENPTRYIMEVYEAATATGTPTIREVKGTGENTFDVILKDAQVYTILFWADYGTPSSTSNEYNADDLKAVKVATGKTPTKVAFSKALHFTGGESVTTAVVLTHAVAQVTFEQTEILTESDNTLVITYPESYSLNVDDDAATKIAGAVTHTFNYNNTAAGVMGTSYIIAGSGDNKSVLNIKMKLNSDTEKEASNVPFERNFKTNVKGKYNDTKSTTFTVTCDDDWSNPDNSGTVEEPKVTYAVGDYYPAGSTKETAAGVVFWVDPLNAAKGKIVSLDAPSSTIKWSTENTQTDVTSETDGAANTAAIIVRDDYTTEKYPAVAWCVGKGTGWYLPAKDEIVALLSTWNADKDGFNAKLTTSITSTTNYWSSTETAAQRAWYGVGTGAAMGMKNFELSARAIFAF